jgi:hypothetical protein
MASLGCMSHQKIGMPERDLPLQMAFRRRVTAGQFRAAHGNSAALRNDCNLLAALGRGRTGAARDILHRADTSPRLSLEEPRARQVLRGPHTPCTGQCLLVANVPSARRDWPSQQSMAPTMAAAAIGPPHLPVRRHQRVFPRVERSLGHRSGHQSLDRTDRRRRPGLATGAVRCHVRFQRGAGPVDRVRLAGRCRHRMPPAPRLSRDAPSRS